VRSAGLAGLAALLMAAAPSSAGAATFNVACGNTAALSSAITSANSTTTADTIEVTGAPCGSGATAGFVLTTAAAPGSGGNDTGLPIVTQPLTINGHGATIQRASSAPSFRLLFANGVAAALTLHDLVLSGGKLTGSGFVGAGLAGLGAPMTLDNVTLVSNQSTAGIGAGVAVFGGSATIDHSTIDFNVASSGAGLYSISATTVVRRSLFFENVATNAGHTGSTGGALVAGGTTTLENDTFSLNVADNSLGAIGVINNGAAGGVANVSNTTLADNGGSVAAGAAPGGALFTCASACGGTGTPAIHAHNSIVADTDSTAAAALKPCDADFGGVITNDGGNIEWPGNTCAGFTKADPKLAAIALNGGATFNYRLLPTSPAIDLGTSPCPATDQRDKVRPGGDGCDSGSYETHPPQTTAAAGSPTKSPSVTFSSDEPNSTFECRVDSGAFSPCTSPFTPGGLSDGSHTADVRASAPDPSSTGAGANTYTDPSPAHVSFVVDKTAPVVNVTDVASPTKDPTPDVTFTVDDGSATVTCKVDSGTAQLCSSPFTPASLGDGSHTVTVTATDAAGNSASDSTTFTVDTTPPTTSIDSGPSGTIFTATSTFTFSSNEAGSSFECKLDTGDWASCTSPDDVTVDPGDHTFSVRATDAAGNTDPSPPSRTFTYVDDTNGPVVAITSAPASPTNDTTPTLEFTVDDPTATVTCKVDSRPAVPCASPYTVSPALADGDHTVTVIAVDPAHNAGHDSATFTVDTAPPETTIDSGPSGTVYNTNSVTFAFSSSENGSTFECKLDNADFAPCDSGDSVAVDPGDHTFQVRATDPAGNTDPDPATRTFTVVEDHTAPTVNVDAVTSPTNDPTPSVSFTTDDSSATTTCAVDGGDPAPCSSPFTTAHLSDGSHTVTVFATDPAGNVGEDATTFTVDTAPPDTSIDSGPSGTIYNATSATFSFSSTEVGSSFECKVNSGDWGSCTSPDTVSVIVGDNTFQVRATDPAGNTDPAPASRTFTNVIDTTAPVVNIVLAPSDPTNRAKAKFAFTVDDPSASVKCKVDGQAPQPCSSPFTTDPLSDGTHTVTISATDPAGNTGSDSRTFTVDTVPPQTTILKGPVGPHPFKKGEYQFVSSEPNSTFECRLDGAPWEACTSPHSIQGYSVGQHTFEVRARDQAGNVDPTPDSRTFRYTGCAIPTPPPPLRPTCT
jgi:Big-like domain-containing protein